MQKRFAASSKILYYYLNARWHRSHSNKHISMSFMHANRGWRKLGLLIVKDWSRHGLRNMSLLGEVLPSYTFINWCELPLFKFCTSIDQTLRHIRPKTTGTEMFSGTVTERFQLFWFNRDQMLKHARGWNFTLWDLPTCRERAFLVNLLTFCWLWSNR